MHQTEDSIGMLVRDVITEEKLCNCPHETSGQNLRVRHQPTCKPLPVSESVGLDVSSVIASSTGWYWSNSIEFYWIWQVCVVNYRKLHQYRFVTHLTLLTTRSCDFLFWFNSSTNQETEINCAKFLIVSKSGSGFWTHASGWLIF